MYDAGNLESKKQKIGIFYFIIKITMIIIIYLFIYLFNTLDVNFKNPKIIY